MEGGQVPRRVRVERIVAASIVTDFEAKWPEVECCVTPDMLSDEYCRDIFGRVASLDEQGAPVNIKTVWQMGPGTKEDGARLIELTTHHYFDQLRMEYTRHCELIKTPHREATFADYVTQLIKYNEQ